MSFSLEPHSHLANGLQPIGMAFGLPNDASYLQTPASSSASLGQEFLINDSGEVSPVYGAAARGTITSHTTASTSSAPPAPTLVGSAGGFQIDLVWDSSVAKAPSGFTAAIIAAATYYTTLFSNDEVINIDVGYGEIDGSSLASNALGESESYGYLTNYTTIKNALAHDNDPLQVASNEPTTSQFFVTSADAKTLGLISGTSTAVDGYIGFSSLSSPYSWNYATSGSGTGSNQFDLVAVAEHEISEVMGRIGLEGEIVDGKPTYTPLDLFNYKSSGDLELSAKGGYFSVNDGVTNLGTYNDASVYGGDIADWASSVKPTGTTYDAYNAFTWPGYNGVVSSSDIIEDAALGYKLTTVA